MCGKAIQQRLLQWTFKLKKKTIHDSMKRTFYIKTAFAVLAMTAFMACTESYPTMTYEEPNVNLRDLNDERVSDRTPVLLFVNQQDLFTVTATRGMGQFPPSNPSDYTKGSVYVYAFRDGNNIQGELTEIASLANTAYATANKPAGIQNDSTEFKDCLIDGTDYNLGLRTHIQYGSSGELTYKPEDFPDKLTQDYNVYGQVFDRTCYYSDKYQETPYNFFAYYIDELDKNRSQGNNAWRNKDSIWYDLTIDGTQDIMCGMAEPMDTAVLKKYYDKQTKKISDNERSIILNGYSKFAADRDIHPYIKMKHMLTQLRFKIYPGDSTAGDVVIQGIRVKFKKRVHLCVATQNPRVNKPNATFRDFYADYDSNFGNVVFPDDEVQDYYDDDGTKIDKKGYAVTYDAATMEDKKWHERPYVQVGKGIIIPPDSIYEVFIDYKQKVKTKNGNKKTWTKDTQHSKKTITLVGSGLEEKIFKTGYIYNINIAVYGNKEIEVYTALSQWKEGGEIPVNDEGWEEE